MWAALAAMLADKMNKSNDAAQQRQQTAGQMKGDFAAALYGGGNSYRAPPPPSSSTDYSGLMSMFSKGKSGASASDGSKLADDSATPSSTTSSDTLWANKKNPYDY
jgi:hypothetical protein